MIRKSTIIIVIITGFNGCSNTHNSWADKDFGFTVEFSPAFLQTGQIIIESTNNSQQVCFQKIYFQRPELNDSPGYLIESVDSLVQCHLNDNCFSQSVHLRKIEQANLTNSDIKQFMAKLRDVELTTQENLIKEGILDGVTVFLRFQNRTHDNVFAMRCPTLTDSVEYLIISSVMDLAIKNLKKKDSKQYFKELKEYF